VLRVLSLLWKRKWRHSHTEDVIKMLFAENLIVEKRRASLHISECGEWENHWFMDQGGEWFLSLFCIDWGNRCFYDANGCFPETLSVSFTSPDQSYELLAYQFLSCEWKKHGGSWKKNHQC
jgi:hypothetical protein